MLFYFYVTFYILNGYFEAIVLFLLALLQLIQMYLFHVVLKDMRRLPGANSVFVSLFYYSLMIKTDCIWRKMSISLNSNRRYPMPD